MCSKWKRIRSGDELTSQALLRYLLAQTCGSILLNGYSGCGKTELLNKLKSVSSRSVFLFSYRDIVDEMLRTNCSCDAYLWDLSSGNCIIAIEDVDYLRGKDATQEYLSKLVQIGAQKHLIILTGNDVEKHAEVLYQHHREIISAG